MTQEEQMKKCEKIQPLKTEVHDDLSEANICVHDK